MSTNQRITLRLVQQPSEANSITSSYSSAIQSHLPRGVLMPLPPTLNALKSSTMEYALTIPFMKQIMQQAKLKRKQDRLQSARKRSKLSHTTTATMAEHKSQHPPQSSKSMMSGGDEKEMADGDEEMKDDSEDENDSLPMYWPFSWRFSIDGGELRNAETYSALVRDRDCIDAELLIHAPRDQGWIPVGIYTKPQIIDVENEEEIAHPSTATASSSSTSTTAARPSSKTSQPHSSRHSPLVPDSTSPNPLAMKPAARGHRPTSTTAPTATHTAASHDTHMKDVSTSNQPPSSASQQRDGRTTVAASDGSSSATGGSKSSDGSKISVKGNQARFDCCSPNCRQPASLGPCPHCEKVGRNNSFFCTQECFTKNWNLHSAQFHPSSIG